MKPQLAEDADLAKRKFPCWGLPKIDGVRGLNPEGTFVGRSLKEFKGFGVTALFSKPDYVGLDGEVTLGDDPTSGRLCGLTSGALGRFKGVTEVEDFTWWIFDYLGEDAIYADKPYRERYEMAYDLVISLGAPLRIVPRTVIHNREEADAFLAKCLDEGYEGVIWRNPDAPAKEGRSDKGQQYERSKPWGDFEIIVDEVIEGNKNTNEAKTNALGRTERSSAKEGMVPNGMIGALRGRILKDVVWNGRVLFPKGMVIDSGTGEMTDAEAAAWFKDQTQIVGHIAKIKTLMHGVKDKPRMPTFLSKRLAEDMDQDADRASSGAAQAAPFAKDSWQHAVDNQLVGFGRTSQEFANPHEATAWLAIMNMELGHSNEGAAQAVRPDPKNCTASVGCTNGRITTKSCVTGKPLIDKGGSSDGERDYYECPDCGKDITIDYREN